jgi:hypothetical protein
LIGCKQHFKFFNDFYEYVKSEVKRKEHWDNASEYTAYWEKISNNPKLSAMYEGSLKYSKSIQLVDIGLMKLPDDFITFIDNIQRCPKL